MRQFFLNKCIDVLLLINSIMNLFICLAKYGKWMILPFLCFHSNNDSDLVDLSSELWVM